MGKMVYKIRNKAGQFSMGGTMPHWSKEGKVWKSKSALSSHLSLVAGSSWNRVDPYADAEIVEFEMVETERQTINLQEYRDALMARKEEAEAARKASQAGWRLAQAQRQAEEARENLIKVRKEYGFE